jgi:glycosyltransferase involved in cell wall biosynthesis/SAM-dependent methyltransferase
MKTTDAMWPIAVNLRTYTRIAAGGMDDAIGELVGGLAAVDSAGGRKVTILCRAENREIIQRMAPTAECVVLAENTPESARAWLVAHPHRLLFCPLSVLDPMECPAPAVTLMTDLEHEFFPENFTPAELRWRRANYWPTAVRSRVVLTNSEFLKKAMVERYRVAADKIVVLELDAAERFRRLASAEAETAFRGLDLPPVYFLCPGDLRSHERANLVRALGMLREAHPEVGLVCSGDAPPDLRMAQVRDLGEVDPEVRVAIYRHSLGLVYPAALAGGGLSVLEAFHCESPVIAGNAAVCREVAGDAALLVDATNPAEIAAAMRRVVEDGALVEEMKRRGKAAVACRSWERTVSAALRAMEDATVELPGAPLVRSGSPEGCWCGAAESEAFSPDYQRCAKCLTLFRRELPPDDFVQVDEFDRGLYGGNYWFSHQTEDLNLPSLEERSRLDLPERNVYWLSHLLRYVPVGKKVLEFGCAHGSFVALMRQAGYDATGLEMSATIVAYARATFDIPMLHAPVDRYPELRGSFDAMVSMDVVEHFRDPVKELRRYAEFLVPDGIFLVQTPCFYRPERPWDELVRDRDRFLEQLKPEHIYLFNEDSLREIFARVGFPEVVKLRPFFGYDQFVVASRRPLAMTAVAEYEARLLERASGRMALALLDGLQFVKAAADRLEALNAVSAQAEMLGAAAAERLAHMIEKEEAIQFLHREIARRDAELGELRAQLAAIRGPGSAK